MKNPVLKINLLIRAETALARVRARRTANRIILSLVALVFVLIGVAMLNFSMYQAFALRGIDPLLYNTLPRDGQITSKGRNLISNKMCCADVFFRST